MVVFFGYDPRREMAYDTLSRYFQDPLLYKTNKKYKDPSKDGLLDVYGIRVQSYLLKDKRFVIAMVLQNDSIQVGEPVKLSSLKWQVLQIRSLTDDDPDLDPLPLFTYEIDRDLLNSYKLFRTEMTDDVTSYSVSSDLPIVVHLLHRKKGPYEYSEEGTLLAAVETYQTILCMKPVDEQNLAQSFLGSY